MSNIHLINDTNLFWQNASWVASITGIIALVVSLVISLRGFSHQKNLTILQLRANAKEKWIDDLKDKIVLFIFYSSKFNECIKEITDQKKLLRAYTAHTIIPDANPQLQIEINKIEDSIQKNHEELLLCNTEFLRLSIAIRLILEKDNAPHQEIMKLLENWVSHSRVWQNEVSQFQFDESARQKISEEGLNISYMILEKVTALINLERESLFRKK